MSRPLGNATAIELEDGRSNLAHLLWDGARDRPQQAAVEDRDGAMHYAPLALRASAVASHLVGRRIRPGDRVAVLLDRGPDAVAALFGTYASGAVAVMINERLRPRQIEYLLNHCSARVLMTAPDVLQRQPRPIATTADLVDVTTIPADAAFEPLPRLARDPAQIIYTSGSTGLPKGVLFTHGALTAGTRAVAGYLGLTGDDRVAGLLPLSTVYGLNQLLCTVTRSATLVVDRSPVPLQVAATIRDRGVTVLAAVPPLWLQLLDATPLGEAVIPGLRVLQNAGGHLPAEVVRRLRRAQPQAQLFLQYGQTETFRSTYLAPEEVDHRPGSIGRAIAGARVLVLRDNLTPCEADEIGELVCQGPAIASGYWNDPEATARVFRPDPLPPAGAAAADRVVFSGDLVRRDQDGFLYFVGRRDRMIKTMGYRVGPDEVVDVLHASGEVSEALVHAEHDPERGHRIIAHVVLDAQGSLQRLNRFCRLELPGYMQPARIEARDALPRLPSGKYDLERLGPPRPA